ncbi:hypothetical protein [Acidovorax phage ACPWH]|nr:hypothetical protein [Acidovorax phage ACPWH]
MKYEVEYQIGEMKYTVRGDDIDGTVTLIRRLVEEDTKSPHDKAQAAIATLEGMGFEHRGGVLWARTQPRPKAPDLFAWVGGPQPPGTIDTKVSVLFRDGTCDEERTANQLRWEHEWRPDDIVAYKVLA